MLLILARVSAHLIGTALIAVGLAMPAYIWMLCSVGTMLVVANLLLLDPAFETLRAKIVLFCLGSWRYDAVNAVYELRVPLRSKPVGIVHLDAAASWMTYKANGEVLNHGRAAQHGKTVQFNLDAAKDAVQASYTSKSWR